MNVFATSETGELFWTEENVLNFECHSTCSYYNKYQG